MPAQVFAATNIGFDSKLITVECDASNGLPGLLIVGLGNKAIDEARERVRSAIKNTNLDFPRKRITINLAPANLPKDGAHFDLPIALALLCVSGQLNLSDLTDTLFVGELALDGRLRPVKGAIGYTELAKTQGFRTIVLPKDNCHQAQLVTNIQIIGAESLKDIYCHLKKEVILPYFAKPIHTLPLKRPSTIHNIQGQEQAKRALLIAAAGQHNILFNGPPGAGKTMLAKSLLSILPAPSHQEIIEITKVHNLAGEIGEEIITERPFRSPHHSASHISLIGGGNKPKPGEISLAHRGVLFLDELPEYSRLSLESLRQPLEDKQVNIARANDRVTYPADFMLVATQNPCPCGFAGDQEQLCSCSALQISNYQRKISGPLLDRLDLVVQVSRVEHDQLLGSNAQTIDYQALVHQARDIQYERFKSAVKTNSHLNPTDIRTSAQLNSDAKSLLDTAAKKLHLSARSYFKVIKVARTIADLEASTAIKVSHVTEALQYRPRN